MTSAHSPSGARKTRSRGEDDEVDFGFWWRAHAIALILGSPHPDNRPALGSCEQLGEIPRSIAKFTHSHREPFPAAGKREAFSVHGHQGCESRGVLSLERRGCDEELCIDCIAPRKAGQTAVHPSSTSTVPSYTGANASINHK